MLLSVDNLEYSYNNKKILNGLSYSIDKPGVVGILGKNGSGKTTMFNCIQGIREDYMGSVKVFGYEAKDRKREMLADIGVQMQTNMFFKQLTVKELFKFIASLYERDIKDGEIMTLLDKVKMQGDVDSYISKLSGGQRQRVSLAMSIMNNPKLLFMDEPTVGLDVQSRMDLWQVIKDIKECGTTILLSTHYIQEVENICDRVIVIDSGSLILDKEVIDILHSIKLRKKIIFKREDLYDSITEITGKLKAEFGENVNIIITEDEVYIHTNDTAKIMSCINDISDNSKANDYDMSIQSINLEDVFMDLTGGIKIQYE